MLLLSLMAPCDTSATEAIVEVPGEGFPSSSGCGLSPSSSHRSAGDCWSHIDLTYRCGECRRRRSVPRAKRTRSFFLRYVGRHFDRALPALATSRRRATRLRRRRRRVIGAAWTLTSPLFPSGDGRRDAVTQGLLQTYRHERVLHTDVIYRHVRRSR